MTRSEAKRFDINTSRGLDHHTVIDEIYDDFESRTCENCRYSFGDWSLECINSEVKDMLRTSYIGYPSLNPSKSFGCNKFERKTDE